MKRGRTGVSQHPSGLLWKGTATCRAPLRPHRRQPPMHGHSSGRSPRWRSRGGEGGVYDRIAPVGAPADRKGARRQGHQCARRWALGVALGGRRCSQRRPARVRSLAEPFEHGLEAVHDPGRSRLRHLRGLELLESSRAEIEQPSAPLRSKNGTVSHCDDGSDMALLAGNGPRRMPRSKTDGRRCLEGRAGLELQRERHRGAPSDRVVLASHRVWPDTDLPVRERLRAC